jgi:hypothetical protein
MWLSHFLLCWLPLVASQVLTSPRDEPIIYSSNPATRCCSMISHHSDLFACINQTISEVLTSPPRVSLVSYMTPNILKYGSLGAAINAVYAMQHKYQFKILTPSTGGEYFPEDQRWNKVKILEDAIHPVTGWAKSSEYIVWLDSDLIFLDLDLDIELIAAAHPSSHVIMSEDVDLSLGIANTGFVLIRNTNWSYHFLSAWWNNYNKSQGMDQWVLSKLYEDHLEEYQHFIKLLPVDAVNTNFPSWMNQLPANQILHLAGANREMRERSFHKGFENICENVNMKSESVANDKKKRIPRQLGLSRETLAGLDSSLPRAQILRETLKKIRKLELNETLDARQVIQVRRIPVSSTTTTLSFETHSPCPAADRAQGRLDDAHAPG